MPRSTTPVGGGYEMIEIAAGNQTLTGGQALASNRARIGTSDYARMGRQRCVLAAMVDQLNPARVILSLSDLLSVLEDHLITDAPVDLVPDLLRLGGRVETESIRMIGFDQTWRSGVTAAGYHVPDVERIRAAVEALINDPDSAIGLGARPATDACF